MAELTVSTKQDKDGTIAAPLGEAGIHIHVDEDYYKRREEVRKYFEIADDEIKDMNLTPTRSFLLKRTYKVLSFVNSVGAAGIGGDNNKFYRAMGAARNLCQRNIEDLLYCQAADDEVGLICLDRLSCVEKLPMATFRKDNSTIQKAFTVNSPLSGAYPKAGEGLDEDTKEDMLWARQQRLIHEQNQK